MIDVRFEKNAAQIKDIVTNPDIYACVSDDYTSDPRKYYPDFSQNMYLSAFVDDEAAAILMIKPISHTIGEVHIQVLPKFRKQHALEIGELFLGWVRKNFVFGKLETRIPVIYPNVKAYAERIGFEVEGVSKKSIWKDGELVDQEYFGLVIGE